MGLDKNKVHKGATSLPGQAVRTGWRVSKVTLTLTRIFPSPNQKAQDMVDSVREPEGAGLAIKIENAPEH